MSEIIPIFSIDNVTNREGTITAVASVNKNSKIFNGHFPGQPVVPGACTLQLVKDVLEVALDHPLQLKRAGNLKFISMIDPGAVSQVTLTIRHTTDNGEIAASAQLHCNQAACFKFQGTFTTNS